MSDSYEFNHGVHASLSKVSSATTAPANVSNKTTATTNTSPSHSPQGSSKHPLPSIHRAGPITKHPYAKPGVYPVTVQVTDNYAQTADASLQTADATRKRKSIWDTKATEPPRKRRKITME
eukprot:753810_1